MKCKICGDEASPLVPESQQWSCSCTYKRRMRTVDVALGFEELYAHLNKFMRMHNFTSQEIRSVIHLINSYYFMAIDLENFKEIK